MECTRGKRIGRWFNSEVGKLVKAVNSAKGESTVLTRHMNTGQSEVAQTLEFCPAFWLQSAQQDFPDFSRNAANTEPGRPVNIKISESKRMIEVIWKMRIIYYHPCLRVKSSSTPGLIWGQFYTLLDPFLTSRSPLGEIHQFLSKQSCHSAYLRKISFDCGYNLIILTFTGWNYYSIEKNSLLSPSLKKIFLKFPFGSTSA